MISNRPIDPNDAYARYFSNQKVQPISYPAGENDSVYFGSKTEGFLTGKAIFDLTQQGQTLQEIAEDHKLTVQGVRDRLTKYCKNNRVI
jgi:hypothetical protein